LNYGRDWLTSSDLDPAVVMWGLRKRVDLAALPDRRIVVRFEFSAVPESKTKYRVFWLVLERSGADVCLKDPGFPVDLIVRGKIHDFVTICLGYEAWSATSGKTVAIEGDRSLAVKVPVWLRLHQVVGRDFPVIPAA
jgi:hypothetical protein